MKNSLVRLAIGFGLIATIATAAGCTDRQQSRILALGDAARVTCYSGGTVIYDDFSTGKVGNSEGSDGYEFKSATTKRLAQVSGDCVVDYDTQPPVGWKAVLP